MSAEANLTPKRKAVRAARHIANVIREKREKWRKAISAQRNKGKRNKGKEDYVASNGRSGMRGMGQNFKFAEPSWTDIINITERAKTGEREESR